MENFELLGKLAIDLHDEFRRLYYVLLPLFFAIAVAMQWFRPPTGHAGFLDIIRRAVISTLLLVGFQEITDTILFITSGIADRISDMRGLDSMIQMAGEKAKGYTLSTTSILLAFDDLIVATITYLSFLVLYVARYIMVAVYHFSWVFLSILAPILLLFHVFTPQITLNLFRSMIEIASWKVVWAVLSAILWALPFGNAFAVDGNYLTVIVINFVIALCMVGTPMVVRSLIGGGFSSMAATLGPVVATAMVAAPVKAGMAFKAGREALSDTVGFGRNIGAKTYQGTVGRVISGAPVTPSSLSSLPGKSPSNDTQPRSPVLPAPPINK